MKTENSEAERSLTFYLSKPSPKLEEETFSVVWRLTVIVEVCVCVCVGGGGVRTTFGTVGAIVHHRQL